MKWRDDMSNCLQTDDNHVFVVICQACEKRLAGFHEKVQLKNTRFQLMCESGHENHFIIKSEETLRSLVLDKKSEETLLFFRVDSNGNEKEFAHYSHLCCY